MTSVGVVNISLTILVAFEGATYSESLEKTWIDFSNNAFPEDTGITNFFHYIWGI